MNKPTENSNSKGVYRGKETSTNKSDTHSGEYVSLADKKYEENQDMISWRVYLVAMVVLGAIAIGGGILFAVFSNENAETDSEVAMKTRSSFAENDLKSAEEIAQSAVEKDDKNVDALLALATTLAQKGSVTFSEEKYGSRAIELAEQVLALDPNNAEAYRIIGYAHEIQEQYDRAVSAYDKAIALDSDMALAYSQKGHALELSGDTAKAESLYIQALNMDPELDHALLNMARIHYGRGEFEKTKQALADLFEVSDHKRFLAEGYQLRGVMAIAEDDLSGAIDYFDKALAIDDTLIAAITGKAEARMYMLSQTADDLSDAEFQNEIDEITSSLQRANEIYSNFTAAYMLMAQVLMMTGDSNGAQTFLGYAEGVLEDDITLTAAQKQEYAQQIDRLQNEFTQ